MSSALNTEIQIVLAQLNFMVGDVGRNLGLIIESVLEVADPACPQVVVLPELALCGYPPEDLLMRGDFLGQVAEAMDQLAQRFPEIVLVVGYAEKVETHLFNSAAVLYGGKKIANYRKQCLPNYRLFDEKRYFESGTYPSVFSFQGVCFGLTICEDIWTPEPALAAKKQGADILLSLNASPFNEGKSERREQIVRTRAQETGLPVLYCNLVGGQDEFVFDGASFAMSAEGQIVGRAPICEPSMLAFDWNLDHACLSAAKPLEPQPARLVSIYRALQLAVRDYVDKNGFPGVVIGLSGGIDSALTLALAVDALGADRVMGVFMPSRYSARMSEEDARWEAQALGVQFEVIPIESVFKDYLQLLEPLFKGAVVDTTEQNLQARCRGNLLMAIANKQGKMVLTTSNKSEMAVGYATLYGDMAGGYALLRDVPKQLVYELSRYRNQLEFVIPERVLEREPSAELAPDQRDLDSLPAYEILDDIVLRYVERDESFAQIVATGHEPDVVERILTLINRNEYKRFQAPPGPRICQRAFGRDRRFPLTSGFRSQAKI